MMAHLVRSNHLRRWCGFGLGLAFRRGRAGAGTGARARARASTGTGAGAGCANQAVQELDLFGPVVVWYWSLENDRYVIESIIVLPTTWTRAAQSQSDCSCSMRFAATYHEQAEALQANLTTPDLLVSIDLGVEVTLQGLAHPRGRVSR